jgi:hypothetical protein
MDAEQAEGLIEHLRGALDTGAQTIVLLSTLEEVPDNPRYASDFPMPEVHIISPIYVIGFQQDLDTYAAVISEHADLTDH